MRHLMCKFKLVTDLEEIPFPSPEGGYLVSEKYDGMFAFWDGGWSMGMRKSQVPFANCNKDKKDEICTGLWSKDGNVIQAPMDWLAHLPSSTPLFGELWAGYNNYQTVVSTCKKKIPEGKEWGKIKFIGFHRPNLNYVFRKGSIRYSNKHIVYLEDNPVEFTEYGPTYGVPQVFHHNVHDPIYLKKLWDTLRPDAEGLVIRPFGVWSTSSTFPHAFKIKRKFDSEARVLSLYEGEKRLLGMMGGMNVEWKGKVFKIGGGFTDRQRVFNGQFSEGDMITFSYRKLSEDGIPMEARFVRKREFAHE